MNIDSILRNNLNSEQIKEVNRIYYGREDHCEIKLKESTKSLSEKYNFEISAYAFDAAKENVRKPNIVKVGLIQHSMVLPTDKPIDEQKIAVFKKLEKLIEAAALENVQILCLQETWSMPFFLCTGEKEKWSKFAESAISGQSTTFLSNLATKYKMVIISPILENDNGVWWNTAVIIDEEGNYIGKHRKNHLPSVGSFSEISYYAPGDTGHPVFKTKYANIAVNICYGRHHALNWLMFGINGADIVFNPAATIAEFGESFWGIEARTAAVANGLFTCSLNRVGTEEFQTEKSKITRTYYGSSYITAPNGCRTLGLSKDKDGLLVVEIDLNLNRQMRDQWGFNMTSRLETYGKTLGKNFNKIQNSG